MKWLLSIVFAVLVTLFWADFAPVYKSLVYAQSTPTDASTSADEDVGEQKASKEINTCDNFGNKWTFKIKKGKITGKAVGPCVVWDVAGTYDKKTKAILLIATNPNPNPSNECGPGFTCTGTFNKKTKLGSGISANGSVHSGSWSTAACQ